MVAKHDGNTGLERMKHLELIAVDLDGPLLTDSFAPLLRQSCEFGGLAYTREMEDNMFSRNRKDATRYFMSCFSDNPPESLRNKSHEEMIADYFAFRAAFLEENPIQIAEGAEAFLQMAGNLGVQLICYGGLDEDYMRRELGPLGDVFDAYVCTNDFRPGVREIVQDIGKVAPDRALFIDDVNFVARHARDLGTAFVGLPARTDWGFQRAAMIEDAVPFVLDHLGQIDAACLEEIDDRAASGAFWTGGAA